MGKTFNTHETDGWFSWPILLTAAIVVLYLGLLVGGSLGGSIKLPGVA